MNIFVTSTDPRVCAQDLDDRRLIKMTLETAQLLSTNGFGPYRPTHKNHPVTRWVALHSRWVSQLFYELCGEYTIRFKRVHACEKALRLDASFIRLRRFVRECGVEDVQEWARCHDHEFDHLPIIEAYRETLMKKWRNDTRPPRWTGRDQPHWNRREE